ncbi:MAG: restriction endonuclease subunit S [Clostridia bacterium]|nr:restriction endonuclease subunit S [Clostridia bacterium]
MRLFQYVFGFAHVRLGDVATITRGIRVVKNQLDENGEYPVYQNSLTPLGYYKVANRSSESTFVISAGAAGEIGFSEVAFWAADDCLCFDSNDCINSKYLYYSLQKQYALISSQVRRAGVPRLSRSVIENVFIFLPPIEEQNRIVGILDRFDKLCNDISEGLPAEIEARQKQYEYYRDKLLKFEKI